MEYIQMFVVFGIGFFACYIAYKHSPIVRILTRQATYEEELQRLSKGKRK